MTPQRDREKTTQLMMETFKVPALAMENEGVLALSASLRRSGVSLCSGDGVTHVVPIYEGRVLHHAIQRINMGGRDLTNYLSVLLTERGSISSEFK